MKRAKAHPRYARRRPDAEEHRALRAMLESSFSLGYSGRSYHTSDPDRLRQVAELAAAAGLRLPFQGMVFVEAAICLPDATLDLRGADFTRADLNRARLWSLGSDGVQRPADLQGACFDETIFCCWPGHHRMLRPADSAARRRYDAYFPLHAGADARDARNFLWSASQLQGVDLRGAWFRRCYSGGPNRAWSPWSLALAQIDGTTRIRELSMGWFPPHLRARWRAFSWTLAFLTGDAHPWMGPEPEGALVDDLPALPFRPIDYPTDEHYTRILRVADRVLRGERPAPVALLDAPPRARLTICEAL